MALGKVEICGVNTAKLPILSSEQKGVLFDKILSGDNAAREEYIKGNLRLVLSVIQRFNNRGEHVDDLFQVGCIGLIKAIDNFTGGVYSNDEVLSFLDYDNTLGNITPKFIELFFYFSI